MFLDHYFFQLAVIVPQVNLIVYSAAAVQS
jgi:hypothetical protein